MRAPVLVVSALLVLLPVACHKTPTYSPSEAAQRTDQLAKLRTEIYTLAEAHGCKAAAGCRVAGIGYNRCGGPRQHVVYCGAATDEVTLTRKIDELTKLEEEDAKHVSDPPPCKQAVAPAPELAEGVCRAKL